MKKEERRCQEGVADRDRPSGVNKRPLRRLAEYQQKIYRVPGKPIDVRQSPKDEYPTQLFRWLEARHDSCVVRS